MPPDGMSGGDKLMSILNRINQRLAQSGSGPEVRVGFLEGATYPDGKSVAMIAAIQEFGGGHVPPRPFFRNMIKAKAPTWGDSIGKMLRAASYDGAKTMGRMGELIKGQLQQSIVDLTSPPLAPATVARKGFEKPLVDTGNMLNSVDYEVST